MIRGQKSEVGGREKTEIRSQRSERRAGSGEQGAESMGTRK